jgi:hypothetical protein
MTHQHQPLPSLDRLHELFQPQFTRGQLVWRQSRGKAKAGKIAGALGTNGYTKVQIEGRTFLAHRLLYAMYHGVDPGSFEVDHVDLDRTDNRASNLRLASRAQNSQNVPCSRRGLKGAYRNTSATSKESKPWVSTITASGVRTFLGMFDTEEEAHQAYVKASAIRHGSFGRVN